MRANYAGHNYIVMAYTVMASNQRYYLWPAELLYEGHDQLDQALQALHAMTSSDIGPGEVYDVGVLTECAVESSLKSW